MRGIPPNKTIFIFLSLLLMGLSMPLKDQKSYAGSIEALHKNLPGHVMGWTAEPGDRYFDDQTIFDYINGAGEVYRAYNMIQCLARRYTHPAEPPIVLDVFLMASSHDAFGVFTYDQDGEALQIGQGALYRFGLLGFWKDRFFVSIYSEGETATTRGAVTELGRAVASLIAREGSRPGILSLLPSEGLRPGSIRYFHHHVVLNSHFYLSNENILNLGKHAEAALAEYSRGEESATLLLVLYPGREEARKAHSNLVKHYMPEADAGGMVLLENGKWSGAAGKGNMLAAVFDAHSRTLAEHLLKEVMKTPSQD